ncbi:MAG: hypothetical protein RLZZ385_1617 [Pseudomonadota bacterium]|jgi:hypothetical protein
MVCVVDSQVADTELDPAFVGGIGGGIAVADPAQRGVGLGSEAQQGQTIRQQGAANGVQGLVCKGQMHGGFPAEFGLSYLTRWLSARPRGCCGWGLHGQRLSSVKAMTIPLHSAA